ncbi:unnamed protein product [Fraxinus pennsylvanica]|uniref:Uncharacterized protein n=1 Tax=Fraxinus pennsylvanica TaxID=56036 RepID=A0AAD2DR10_9LAMI|nr:unnamed protein product [Fraxinus pennsylvanica]
MYRELAWISSPPFLTHTQFLESTMCGFSSITTCLFAAYSAAPLVVSEHGIAHVPSASKGRINIARGIPIEKFEETKTYISNGDENRRWESGSREWWKDGVTSAPIAHPKPYSMTPHHSSTPRALDDTTFSPASATSTLRAKSRKVRALITKSRGKKRGL